MRELKNRGLTIRGAVTYGELFHQDDICIGKALINAYYLESNKAIYPRIIIDHKLLKKINLIEEKSARYFIDTHLDGYYFLSDIKPFYKRNDYINNNKLLEAILVNLSINKKIVEEGLNQRPEKYIWSHSYHNYCCEKNAEYAPEYKSDFFALKIQNKRL